MTTLSHAELQAKRQSLHNQVAILEDQVAFDLRCYDKSRKERDKDLTNPERARSARDRYVALQSSKTRLITKQAELRSLEVELEALANPPEPKRHYEAQF